MQKNLKQSTQNKNTDPSEFLLNLTLVVAHIPNSIKYLIFIILPFTILFLLSSKAVLGQEGDICRGETSDQLGVCSDSLCPPPNFFDGTSTCTPPTRCCVISGPSPSPPTTTPSPPVSPSPSVSPPPLPSPPPVPGRDPVAPASDCYYNACYEGPLCELGPQFSSPGDYVLDQEIDFYTEEDKIADHPYYPDYMDYVCQLRRCQSWRSDAIWCLPEAVCECDTFLDTTRTACGAEYDPYGNLIGYDTERQCFENTPPPMVGAPDGEWLCAVNEVNCDSDAMCLNMTEFMEVGYSPGYILSETPYLHDIWLNTVKKQQSIFTPFRTALNQYQYEWPGEETIEYDYDPTTGNYSVGAGWGAAGTPPIIHTGDDARIYFRYLGFIHCAKENLLEKLSSIVNINQPYQYYDPRCDADLW